MVEIILIGSIIIVLLIGSITSLIEKNMELKARKDRDVRFWRDRARKAEDDLQILLNRAHASENFYVLLREEENQELRDEITQLRKEKEELDARWKKKYEHLEHAANQLWPNGAAAENK